MIKTAVLTKLTPELYSEWLDLWNRNQALATAFNSPAWLKAAINAFEYKDVKIVTVRGDGDDLLAVAALIKYRHYGVTVYAAPAIQFADKQSILVDWTSWEAVRALVSALKKLGTISLSYCTEEVRTRLQHVLSDRALTFQDDVNYIVDLSVSPHGDLSSNSRSKIRRMMRKLDRIVNVRFSQDEATDLFQKAYEVDSASTKKERGMSVFSNSEVRSFYEILAALHPKLVNISVMDAEGEPIAYSIELFVQGTYQGSQKAYKKGYEQFQPSKYMVMKILEHAHVKGLMTFDFGRGSSEFKKHFTENVQPVYTVIIPKFRLAGLYLVCVHSLRQITYDTLVKQRSLFKAFKSVRSVLNV